MDEDKIALLVNLSVQYFTFKFWDFYIVLYLIIYIFYWASLVAQRVKHLPVMQKTQVQSLGQEDPWRRKWQPIPVFLPGESHEGRSLVGYSPQGCN